jgi:spore coat protein H
MKSPATRKPLSSLRKIARVFVWAVFAGVLAFRVFVHQPDPEFRAVFPWQQEQPRGRERQNWRAQQLPAQPRSPLPTNLWRIELQLSREDEDSLRSHRQEFHGRGQLQVIHRPSVNITVREGSLVLSNVAAHLKGAAGSFRPYDDTPAFTLNFSRNIKGQRFHGYSKVSLNNSVQDPSLLNEIISREMFLAAGVPVPRAHHASVVVNQRDLGVYVVTEGWGKPFLRSHFDNVSGNLYDGGFVQDIDADLSVVSGDDPGSHTALQRLIDAASDPDRSRRWERISQVLDVERFISLLAMDTLLCNWDGYALNRNNYRVFHDLSTDRLVFMPHGLDQVFGTGRRMGVDSSIDLPYRGGVARSLMSTPEARRRYDRRLRELCTEVFDPGRLEERIREHHANLRPTLAAYSPSIALDHERRVENLVQRVHARFASVREQLARLRDPIEFDASNSVRISDWHLQPAPVGQPPTPANPDSPLLIHLSKEGSDPSWRTRVRIEAGSYRLEGRARALSTVPGTFASLRISGYRGNFVELTDTHWVPLQFPFDVHETLAEIELVALAAGADVTVEFDPDSLRLRRL